MLHPVAVRTQDDALGHLPLEGGGRALILHHFPDGEVLPLAVRVMELKRPVIVEAAPRTAERPFDDVQPRAEPVLAAVLASLLAGPTLVTSILLGSEDLADLETPFIL